MQHISYLRGPRPSSVYSGDFDSEELSLDVKNEDPYVFQIGDPT